MKTIKTFRIHNIFGKPFNFEIRTERGIYYLYINGKFESSGDTRREVENDMNRLLRESELFFRRS